MILNKGPMKSPIPYVGGKSKLAAMIVSMIPPHKVYCEACAGAGWVFFRKDPAISKVEVLNDLDGSLIAFYRAVKDSFKEFSEEFKWELISRRLFDEYKATLEADDSSLTDIQRAARYYYVQKLCFGGKVKSRHFSNMISKPRAPREDFRTPSLYLSEIEQRLMPVHLRLQRCVIENLPALDLISRYDAPGVFFFIDPPYYKAGYYRHNMALDDYRQLADVLKDIKGKFLLTIGDHPEMVDIFGGFEMQTAELDYSVNATRQKKAVELIFTNYTPAGCGQDFDMAV